MFAETALSDVTKGFFFGWPLHYRGQGENECRGYSAKKNKRTKGKNTELDNNLFVLLYLSKNNIFQSIQLLIVID